MTHCRTITVKPSLLSVISLLLHVRQILFRSTVVNVTCDAESNVMLGSRFITIHTAIGFMNGRTGISQSYLLIIMFYFRYNNSMCTCKQIKCINKLIHKIKTK